MLLGCQGGDSWQEKRDVSLQCEIESESLCLGTR